VSGFWTVRVVKPWGRRLIRTVFLFVWIAAGDSRIPTCVILLYDNLAQPEYTYHRSYVGIRESHSRRGRSRISRRRISWIEDRGGGAIRIPILDIRSSTLMVPSFHGGWFSGRKKIQYRRFFVRSRTDKRRADTYDARARLRVRKEVRVEKPFRPVWDVNTLHRRVRRRLKRPSPSPLTISSLPHFPTNLGAAFESMRRVAQ
jgi:hypothetical protein